MTTQLRDASVLVVGAGGLGCAAAPILARSGVGRIDFCDDDRIELSNLPRQLMYHEGDIGCSKVAVAASRIRNDSSSGSYTLKSVAREMRVLPESAVATVRGYDLVLEGTDTFASKFLIADACGLVGIPVVQAGVVRWGGWVLASNPGISACLRCVFEGVPEHGTSCSAAGVVGPVVGVVGALMASVAVRLLMRDPAAAGELWNYRGLSGSIRSCAVGRQPQCRLCLGIIKDTNISNYIHSGSVA